MELYDAGICDKLVSQDGVLVACASYANKGPEPGGSLPVPSAPTEPAVLLLSGHAPITLCCFLEDATGLWGFKASEGSFGASSKNQRRVAAASRSGKGAPGHISLMKVQVQGAQAFVDR